MSASRPGARAGGGSATLYARLLGRGGGADGAGGPGVSLLHTADTARVEAHLPPGALDAGARAVAALLAAQRVRAGARVVLALPTGPDFLAWFLGCLRAGVVPVPVPPPAPGAGGGAALGRLVGVAEDCAPALVVLPAGTGAGGLPEALRGRALEGAARGEAGAAGAPAAPHGGRAAWLQYTSGSTARPRGVVVTHDNARANLAAIGRAVRVRPADRVYSWLPLFHDMGLVGTLLFSLLHRLPLFLAAPASFVFRPASWLRGISAHRATLSPAPHAAYALCAERLRPRDLEGLDLACWRLALDGSEPISAPLARAFLARLAPHGLSPRAYLPVYGLAEATLALTLPSPGEGLRSERVQREALLAEGRALRATPGEAAGALEHVSVGRALPGHALSVHAPRTGRRLPERRVGEVRVEGPSVSPGYHGRARRRGPLRTGDLGYLAGGELFLTGRLKDLVLLGGANLHPEDVERACAGLPGVRSGRLVAFGVPDAARGTERLVVAFEARAGTAPEARAALAGRVRARVREALGVEAEALALPPHALPTTPSGKRMRHQARALYLAGGWTRNPGETA